MTTKFDKTQFTHTHPDGDGQERESHPDPTQLIAEWLNRGLQAFGNDRAHTSGPHPTVRELVFSKFQDWLIKVSSELEGRKLTGQEDLLKEPVSLDLLEIFKYMGKNRVPRQDQIGLFAALAGIDLKTLVDPVSDNGRPPLSRDEWGGLKFRSDLGSNAGTVHRMLIVQLKNQRPDALLEEASETTGSEPVNPNTTTTIRFSTQLVGATAKIQFRNIDYTRFNAQGMPVIVSIKLDFSPKLIDKLRPLSADDYRKYTHAKEPSGSQHHDGNSTTRGGGGKGEPSETSDFDPELIGPIILQDPKWGDESFDYKIFGFQRGLPFTKDTLSRRYRALVALYHPDRNPDLDDTIFKRINEANERLKRKTSGH